jgi:hypothetical protein
MNGLAAEFEMAIRLMGTGWHDEHARSGKERIVTQNRHPLLLNGSLLAEFSARNEP